ncbi:GRAS protein [Tanacetum coccineum]
MFPLFLGTFPRRFPAFPGVSLFPRVSETSYGISAEFPCILDYGFQGTVQRKTKSVTPSRRKPNQIELFERVHKKAKGTGEWCDGRAKRVARQYHERVARQYHEKIKDKHAHEFENVDGGEQ